MEMSLEIDYNSLGNPGSDFKATGTVIEIFFILQSFFVFLNRPPHPCFLVAWITAIHLSLTTNIVQENKPHLIKHTLTKYLPNMGFCEEFSYS